MSCLVRQPVPQGSWGLPLLQSTLVNICVHALAARALAACLCCPGQGMLLLHFGPGHQQLFHEQISHADLAQHASMAARAEELNRLSPRR